MDPTAPLFVWVLILSALSVSALLVVVAAAFAWHQRQALRQAREWGHHLLMAQESERGRIARELHDDVIQRLWSVRLMAQGGDGAKADAALEGVVGDLRTIAHDLHPPALRHLDLGEALRDLAERHFSQGTPSVEIDVPGELHLAESTALALYRVAQEAFTNITKHADKATHVRLALVVLPDQVRLVVEDDGVGIGDANARRSFGLRGIHERMEMLGGRATISSSTGRGTLVSATVPLS